MTSHGLSCPRPLAAILLALTLVVTGQSLALARGTATAAGEMVICTGTGTVTVPVDAEGNPTGPPVVCPDCALTAMAAMPVTQAVAGLALSSRARRTGLPRQVAAVSRERVAPRARGPPSAG
jgi:hypothetical protein